MESLAAVVLLIALALIGVYLYTQKKNRQNLEIIVDNTHREEQVKLDQQVAASNKKVENVKKDYDQSLADYISKYGPLPSGTNNPVHSNKPDSDPKS